MTDAPSIQLPEVKAPKGVNLPVVILLATSLAMLVLYRWYLQQALRTQEAAWAQTEALILQRMPEPLRAPVPAPMAAPPNGTGPTGGPPQAAAPQASDPPAEAPPDRPVTEGRLPGPLGDQPE